MPADWMDRIHALRAHELERVLALHRNRFYGRDVLELGSGSGFQLRALSSICRSTVGLEIAANRYREHLVADVEEYDGTSIPYPDASFDLIYTSHLLAHLIHEDELYEEMRRVLRRGGVAVHVVPTSAWRLWTSLLHYPAMTKLVVGRLGSLSHARSAATAPSTRRRSAWLRQILANTLVPQRLGTRGNWVTEHFLLHSEGWRRRLTRYGWATERIDPLGLWYSGHLMLGPKLSLHTRRALAQILGSSTVAILARPLGPTP